MVAHTNLGSEHRKRRASDGEGAEESTTSMAHGNVHDTARAGQGPEDGYVKRPRVQTGVHTGVTGVTHDTGRGGDGTVQGDGVT